MREEISKILVKWSMPTRQAAISEINQLFQDRLVGLEKKAQQIKDSHANQLSCIPAMNEVLAEIEALKK